MRTIAHVAGISGRPFNFGIADRVPICSRYVFVSSGRRFECEIIANNADLAGTSFEERNVIRRNARLKMTMRRR